MYIVLNGETTQWENGATITDLINKLMLEGPLAITINNSIIPQSEFPNRTIIAEDRVEIIQAIGGG